MGGRGGVEDNTAEEKAERGGGGSEGREGCRGRRDEVGGQSVSGGGGEDLEVTDLTGELGPSHAQLLPLLLLCTPEL